MIVETALSQAIEVKNFCEVLKVKIKCIMAMVSLTRE